ncbi:DoxX family protein [Vibrio artabrorum]|uniref:DoxX family protein n=1 Tax=Vibrio artabrorum TaxID=446374 RepID=UPI00354ADB4A
MNHSNKYYIPTTILGLLSIFTVLFNTELYDGSWSMISMSLFGVAIPICSYIFRKNAVISFLLTTFFTIIVVRNADQHDWSIVGWVTALVFIPLLCQLISLARDSYNTDGTHLTALTLLRTFIGLNWLTHCTEKLFLSHHDVGLVDFFSNVVGPNTIGQSIPEPWVHYVIILGGLVELTAAICLGLGLLTRFGAFVSCAYLVAAQLMSGHFMVGYTWMIPGGGWEVPFYFFMVTYPFMLPRNAGSISLDTALKTNNSNIALIKSFSGA